MQTTLRRPPKAVKHARHGLTGCAKWTIGTAVARAVDPTTARPQARYDVGVLHKTLDLLESLADGEPDRKSTRLNSSHMSISYAVFCLKKKIRKQAALCEIRRRR